MAICLSQLISVIHKLWVMTKPNSDDDFFIIVF